MKDPKIQQLQGRAIVVRGDDIDTDRIIPARFLRCVTFDNLGNEVFYDERFEADGTLKEHPFNDKRFDGAPVLVVNGNFGCGSSREHAPQAILRYGIQTIIGESFADIFAGNCSSIGLPAVTAAPSSIKDLMDLIERDPSTVVIVDLVSKIVEAGSLRISIDLPEPARNGFINGTWDTTSMLLANEPQIHATAARLPYVNGYV